MAIRKKVPAGAQKAAKTVSKLAFGKMFSRTLIVIILLIIGGIVFNIDRLPEFFTRLSSGKDGFIPDGTGTANQVIYGKVSSVYDGDTMTLTADSSNGKVKYKVRFFGIDAPEMKQEYGVASRDALRAKILDKDVKIQVVSVDRYNRCVCKVYLLDRYINREMTAEGHAWYYPDYAEHEIDLKNAQESALRDRRGLWQNRNPQPPWLFRKENRTN